MHSTAHVALNHGAEGANRTKAEDNLLRVKVKGEKGGGCHSRTHKTGGGGGKSRDRTNQRRQDPNKHSSRTGGASEEHREKAAKEKREYKQKALEKEVAGQVEAPGAKEKQIPARQSAPTQAKSKPKPKTIPAEGELEEVAAEETEDDSPPSFWPHWLDRRHAW